MLDARAVVPASVEQNHLARGRQVGDVALEVPLRSFSLGRRRKRHDPDIPRVEQRSHALDDATFAGRVASFKENDHPQPTMPDPLLELHQLDLEPAELFFVVGLGQGGLLLGRPLAVLLLPLLVLPGDGSRHSWPLRKSGRKRVQL